MKLSIIILNYNTHSLVSDLIATIKTKTKHEIIIVDNNSSDNSVKQLTKKHPQIKLIANPKNLGFATGNNVGIKSATGKYILLLNSDTLIQSDAIDHCLNHLECHPQIGILTPKLILPDGAIDLACHRGFPTPLNSLAYFAKLERLFPNLKLFAGYHQTWKNFDTTHQVDAVSGAAMFIRRQVIDQIGLLDERFFMYAEDIDFCHRAKDAGWQVVYFPQAQVTHLKGMSGTKSRHSHTQSSTRHHFYHTMKQYWHKHYSHKQPKIITILTNLAIDILAKLKK